MPELSCSEPAKLIESSLGYAGNVQVSGFLHLRNVCSDEPRSTADRPARGMYSFDLRKRARALCNGAVKDAEVANATNAEEDGILNNNDRCVF